VGTLLLFCSFALLIFTIITTKPLAAYQEAETEQAAEMVKIQARFDGGNAGEEGVLMNSCHEWRVALRVALTAL
jgi:hypothetical protein